jgi:hypothetical protein
VPYGLVVVRQSTCMCAQEAQNMNYILALEFRP